MLTITFLPGSCCFTGINISREKLDKDKEYNFNIKSLKYYVESINKYINNKELYDREISTLSFNNFKKAELKRFSSVSRISVSSSEMEKLNQSIKSKCQQNASEQARGRDAAKSFHVGTNTVDIEIEQTPVKKLTLNN